VTDALTDLANADDVREAINVAIDEAIRDTIQSYIVAAYANGFADGKRDAQRDADPYAEDEFDTDSLCRSAPIGHGWEVCPARIVREQQGRPEAPEDALPWVPDDAGPLD